MDVLANLMNDVRSSGSLFGRTLMEPPWSVRFADGAPLTLVAMLRGNGWLVPDDGAPVRLAARDIALVVGGTHFSVTDDPTLETPPYYIVNGPDHCTTPGGQVVGSEVMLGTRTCGENRDSPNVLLTATYQVKGSISERLLNGLPTVVAVPCDNEPCPILDVTTAEIERDDPGQQAILDRLLDLLLLGTLREWFALPEATPPRWYRAWGDPVVGPALRAIHDSPAQPWTVASLAVEAGTSRATFARRFTEMLDEPPMAYVTNWRLSLAADLLQRTDATLESIARQVGYSNAYALSAAFKRNFGTRPTVHRALVTAA
ncbi:AraC family transcriptional regulator [Phytoactinopolyspora mesophila]|uniref:Helix-turn-helix domain-containing protein n=1 Tax=Phytoactinopolyspora mesophila TaxID=2650750 RepID=A0A7K3M1N4_9ACTN|nr:helix-turn-helix domain-containing protein [Phytoactinopolyspora mesophila]